MAKLAARWRPAMNAGNRRFRRPKWCVWRILGNELPPRDAPGERLRVLQFILENEPQFPHTAYWYLVNRIVDHEYERSVCQLLEKYKADYVRIPCPVKQVREAKTFDDRVRLAIGINAARNFAVRQGRRLSKFTAVLDGDCFFPHQAWNEVLEGVAEDKESRRYYSVPHFRTTLDKVQGASILATGEPMLIFREDAQRLFDEALPFGQGDKLKLLLALGHNGGTGLHWQVRGEQCRSVGYVLHLATGDFEVDENLQKRLKVRGESLTRLINTIVG